MTNSCSIHLISPAKAGLSRVPSWVAIAAICFVNAAKNGLLNSAVSGATSVRIMRPPAVTRVPNSGISAVASRSSAPIAGVARSCSFPNAVCRALTGAIRATCDLVRLLLEIAACSAFSAARRPAAVVACAYRSCAAWIALDAAETFDRTGTATAPNAPIARPAAPIGPAMESSPEPRPIPPAAAGNLRDSPRFFPKSLLIFWCIFSKICPIEVAAPSASAFAAANPAFVLFLLVTVMETTLSAIRNAPLGT